LVETGGNAIAVARNFGVLIWEGGEVVVRYRVTITYHAVLAARNNGKLTKQRSQRNGMN
jgi:hypothetical protein